MLGERKIPIYLLYAAAVIAMAVVLYLLLRFTSNADFRNLLIGIVGGLVVWVLTLFTQVHPMKRLQQFVDSGFLDLRSNRHDKLYYRSILERADDHVWVTGASASRFVEDFLRDKPDSNILLHRMRTTQSLDVRLLVPSRENMRPESRNSYDNVANDIALLRHEFPLRFAIRFFDDQAHISFVLTEKDFVGGPILPMDRSRDTPAIHLRSSTSYARYHQTYFAKLWDKTPDQL